MKKLIGPLVLLGSGIALVGLAPLACDTGPVQCNRATYCHKTDCKGPIVREGCVSCEPGEIDDDKCPHDPPDVVECFFARKCHRTDCNGPIVRSGCDVTCVAGEIDDLACRVDGSADGAVDSSDASDSATDAFDAPNG